MVFTTITLFMVLFLMVGGIFLQIFLSKRENKWLGLVLPCLTFLYAILMVLGVAAYGMSGWEAFSAILSAFLSGNIPTIILLVIYFACREKRKKQKELDKMNIQDLK